MERNVLTIPQLVALYPAFSEPTVRWWIFHAEKFDFGKCIIRIGGRVFIIKEEFDKWLRQHQVVKTDSGE